MLKNKGVQKSSEGCSVRKHFEDLSILFYEYACGREAFHGDFLDLNDMREWGNCLQLDGEWYGVDLRITGWCYLELPSYR